MPDLLLFPCFNRSKLLPEHFVCFFNLIIGQYLFLLASRYPQYYNLKYIIKPFNFKDFISQNPIHLSCYISTGLVVIGIIIGSKKVGINPDNVATPIAASLGDLITLSLLAVVSSILYDHIGEDFYFKLT